MPVLEIHPFNTEIMNHSKKVKEEITKEKDKRKWGKLSVKLLVGKAVWAWRQGSD